MGRKRNTLVDDLLTIFSKLPWWAGVGAAIGAWFIFSRMAASYAGSHQPREVIFGTVAGLARLAVPIICLAGALVSALGRRKRAALLSAAAGTDGASAIAGMSWSEFELLIGEWLRQHGYAIKEAGGRGPDGGVDLIATQGGQSTLVQCKHWKTQRIGVPVVRELFGVMTAERAAACWVVTSGRFTEEARGFANGKPIRLIDGPALTKLLREARASAPARPAAQPSGVQGTPKAAPPTPPPTEPAATPACPRCSSPMVRRTAARGARAGQWFWGCSAFPHCRGTLDPG